MDAVGRVKRWGSDNSSPSPEVGNSIKRSSSFDGPSLFSSELERIAHSTSLIPFQFEMMISNCKREIGGGSMYSQIEYCALGLAKKLIRCQVEEKIFKSSVGDVQVEIT